MQTTTKRTMTDEQRQRHNDYQRQYRAAHPDKTREWRDRYTLKKADRLREQAKADRKG